MAWPMDDLDPRVRDLKKVKRKIEEPSLISASQSKRDAKCGGASISSRMEMTAIGSVDATADAVMNEKDQDAAARNTDDISLCVPIHTHHMSPSYGA